MSQPLYHPHAPGPLMARLFYTFDLYDGTHVSYLRQEAPMSQSDPAAELDAKYAEVLDEMTIVKAEMTIVKDAIRRAAALQPKIEQLWAEIQELEASLGRGQHAATEEQAG